jgi:hypothetical protein
VRFTGNPPYSIRPYSSICGCVFVGCAPPTPALLARGSSPVCDVEFAAGGQVARILGVSGSLSPAPLSAFRSRGSTCSTAVVGKRVQLGA